MSFTPNIPQIGQSLGNSRPQILNNMAVLRSTIATNHYDVNDAKAGKHKYVEMPVLSVIPPGLAASEGTLYVKSVSSRRELFYTNDTSGNEWQLTSLSNSNFATFGTDPGWTFLPGGLLMQWGTETCASGTTVSFSRSFTGAPYTIQCTIFQNTTNRHFVYARTSTSSNFVTTQLDSGGSGETNTFSWVAIGAA